LLRPEPCKHPKTTKLNPNILWMKQFFLKKNIIFSYFPWIILDSWKSNTFYFSQIEGHKISCCIGALHKLHIVGDVLWPAQECFISSKYIGFNIVCTIDSRTCCRHLLCCNNTIEKDDNTLLTSFSFLTQRRRQRQQVAVTFFAKTPP
jgi:hypothetical protein